MNEHLQQELTGILNKTAGGVEAGVVLLKSELPDVIQQLLMWKACISAASMIGFLATVYVIYKINAIQIRWWLKDKDRDFFDHPQLMVNLLQVFWFMPLCGLWSLDWLQIWMAPKIYLIEYAASLAK